MCVLRDDVKMNTFILFRKIMVSLQIIQGKQVVWHDAIKNVLNPIDESEFQSESSNNINR